MASIDIPEYHEARVLLLVDAFSANGQPLTSLTKLAKLDFLLRYPVFLERILDRRRIGWPRGLAPTRSERGAVESRMVRYKYGPWDNRYYPVIGALVGRGLARTSLVGSAIEINLTERGRELAAMLAEAPEWSVVAGRALFLRRHFDSTGARLRSMIYEELPEVVDRPHRSEI